MSDGPGPDPGHGQGHGQDRGWGGGTGDRVGGAGGAGPLSFSTLFRLHDHVIQVDMCKNVSVL